MSIRYVMCCALFCILKRGKRNKASILNFNLRGMTAAVSHNERGMLLRGAVRMLGIAPLLLTKKCQAPEFS